MPRVAALLDVMQISEIVKVELPDTYVRPIYAVPPAHGRKSQTVHPGDQFPAGLTPISDLTLCALAEGWSYNRLIQSVLEAGREKIRIDERGGCPAGAR